MHSDSDFPSASGTASGTNGAGNLKALLSQAPLSLGTIDTALVIRRSRRRRLPRQVGIGSAMTLAVAGIGIAGATGIRLPSPSSFTMTSASDSGPTSESDSGGLAEQPEHFEELWAASGSSLAPVEKLNPCAAPVAQVESTAAGLSLVPQFPMTAEATGTPVSGTVTLQNAGPDHIIGTTAASPSMTLSRDGVTVWHSNGPMIMLAVEVDLAPGESMSYPASVTPVLCTEQDETTESFREGLPALPAGTYSLAAAIYLTTENGLVETITGPAQTITLQ